MKLRLLKKKDKRGVVFDLLIFIIFAFVFALVFGVIYFFITTVNQKFIDIAPVIDSAYSGGNFTDAVNRTIVANAPAFNLMKFAALILIFGMIFMMFFANFYSRMSPQSYPFMIILSLLMLIICMIIAPIISNTYEKYLILIQGNDFGNAINSFVSVNYIILHLPYFVLVIGLINLVLLFVGSQAENSQYYGGGGIQI